MANSQKKCGVGSLVTVVRKKKLFGVTIDTYGKIFVPGYKYITILYHDNVDDLVVIDSKDGVVKWFSKIPFPDYDALE